MEKSVTFRQAITNVQGKPIVRICFLVGLAAILILFTLLLSRFAPLSYDWFRSYRPAALKLLGGQSPYDGTFYLNPPWLLVPLVPFAILPERIGNAAWLLANLGIYVYIATRLGMKVPYTFALIASYPVARSLLYGQIDGLVLLGLFMPPWAGMFLFLSKPQIGLGLAVLAGVNAWKSEGWKGIVYAIVPVGLVFALSIAIYGNFLVFGVETVHSQYNLSLWPYTLPAGVIALYYVLIKQERMAALAAGPLLSPYLAVHSLTNFLLILPANSVEFVIAVAGTWAVRFLGGY